jgi:hypothetical protein
VAFADPVYLGCSRHYDHPRAKVFDTVAGHQRLIARLCDEFPDGWALSLHSPSLRTILPLCPPDVRVAAWVKPFCVWKKGINPVYSWEPVVWRGGRRRDLDSSPAVRDWVSCNIATRTGLVGAKPFGFCCWLFELLGLEPDDELVDLFPGSRAVTRAWRQWQHERSSKESVNP